MKKIILVLTIGLLFSCQKEKQIEFSADSKAAFSQSYNCIYDDPDRINVETFILSYIPQNNGQYCDEGFGIECLALEIMRKSGQEVYSQNVPYENARVSTSSIYSSEIFSFYAQDIMDTSNFGTTLAPVDSNILYQEVVCLIQTEIDSKPSPINPLQFYYFDITNLNIDQGLGDQGFVSFYCNYDILLQTALN